MAIALETILEPAVLRKAWRDARKRERGIHLTQIPLVRDSTGGLAFELSLNDVLESVRRRLLDGTYRPHSPIITEAAKSKLLHRRLSSLAFEDALILGSLVQAARPSLIKKMPAWVSFGRIDQPKKNSKAPTEIIFDYESWWTKWLEFRNLLKVIEGDQNPLLVISDITNFFTSVDLSLLRSKFSSEAILDEPATNLLFFLLENLRPSEGYSPSGSLGLPTVADDTSRILAHFYLWDLDSELTEEGEQGRYTRWVDDMTISVPNEIEGGKVVARIERALSRLRLVANSSKTQLVSKAEFRQNHHEDENEYLDGVHEATEKHGKFTSELLTDFEDRLSNFLSCPNMGQWSRVLSRYYTESRRVRSKTLLAKWHHHLVEFPTIGRHILDYVAFHKGDIEFCDQLFKYLREHGLLHEDVQILLYETLLLKPFPNDSSLRDHLVNLVQSHMLSKDGFEPPTGYVKGLQALTMYKFNSSKAFEFLSSSFIKDVLESPTFATYGLPILAASGDFRELALEGTEQMEDSRILRIRALVERLETGNNRATGVLLNLLQPRGTKHPTRQIINPRALPLLKIALRTQNTKSRNRILEASKGHLSKLTNIEDPLLIDWLTLDHISAAFTSQLPSK